MSYIIFIYLFTYCNFKLNIYLFCVKSTMLELELISLSLFISTGCAFLKLNPISSMLFSVLASLKFFS